MKEILAAGKTNRRVRSVFHQRAHLVERACWTLAALLILPFAVAMASRTVVAYVSQEIANEMVAVGVAADVGTPTQADGTSETPRYDGHADALSQVSLDQSAWSDYRRRSYANLSELHPLPLLGILHMPGQQTSIPVFSGVSEISMTLGAGHLSDTSPLDGNGNIALSAHRDGAFRVLKDVHEGDGLMLLVGDTVRSFTVTRRLIVTPEQVTVLDPTPVPTLTLITCHPFYFVGNAPERFVLQAQLDQSSNHSASLQSPTLIGGNIQ